MNAPIPGNAAVSISEALADDLLVAIEEATDYIIQVHMDLDEQSKDGNEAMGVLHRLLVAKCQIQRESGKVKP